MVLARLKDAAKSIKAAWNDALESEPPAEAPSAGIQLSDVVHWAASAADNDDNFMNEKHKARLNESLAGVILVAGLLVAATYPGLLSGYASSDLPLIATATQPFNTTELPANSSAVAAAVSTELRIDEYPQNSGARTGDLTRAEHFALFSYLSYVTAMLSVFFAIMIRYLLYQLPSWPATYSTLPEPPSSAIGSRLSSESWKCAKALNFLWHAQKYGILTERANRRLSAMLFLAWMLTAYSMSFIGTAAIDALAQHLGGGRKFYKVYIPLAYAMQLFVLVAVHVVLGSKLLCVNVTLLGQPAYIIQKQFAAHKKKHPCAVPPEYEDLISKPRPGTVLDFQHCNDARFQASIWDLAEKLVERINVPDAGVDSDAFQLEVEPPSEEKALHDVLQKLTMAVGKLEGKLQNS